MGCCSTHAQSPVRVFVDIGRIVDHHCLSEVFRKGKQAESENE